MGITLLTTASLIVTGCAATSEEETASEVAPEVAEETFKISMVTDQNGIDDRSFNQSAWEGMQDWAASHDFGEESINYYQSGQEYNYIPNLNTAIQDEADIIYAIGYSLEEALAEIATQNPDQKFGFVDGVIEQDNVVSITFADNESSYLAGVIAALTSDTGRIGFVGGMKVPSILKFQAGYEAGAKSVNPDIVVDVQFAESYSDAGIAQQIASAMYANNVDVIFHAAGNAGNGVNTEARNQLESGAKEGIWVIGADRDQSAEGEWNGGNFMLTSTLKELGRAIENESNAVLEGNFNGGSHIVSNIKSGGVGVVEDHLPADVKAIVEQAKEDIISGAIEVPEVPENE